MENIKIIYKEETDSTNDDVRCMMKETDIPFVVVATDYQRKGRGQTGNCWESEKGSNLLFSIGMRPSFLPVSRQFLLLQVGALALCQTMETYSEGFSIKWPNDIYYSNRKISGTLIESVSCGQNLQFSVLGCGINVNQKHFVSDAPNPVSLCEIIRRDEQREKLFENTVESFVRLYQRLKQGDEAYIQSEYRKRLYRREGCYAYADKNGVFKAYFHDISRNGILTLRTENGELRHYAFKEVSYVI